LVFDFFHKVNAMEKSNTPQSQDNTPNHANDAQNSGTLGNVPPRIGGDPPAPPEHNNPNGNSTQPPWWRQLKVWTFIGEIVLVVITVRIACIYSDQLDQMIESNKINRDALTSVQRAFVFLGEPTTFRIPKDKSVVFYIRFPWENSGTTPTKTLTTHTSWRAQPNPITRDFPFQDVWDEGVSQVNVETLIGPRANTGNNVGPITAPYIAAVQQRKYHLYFWGHANYRDTFDNTPEHITRFCVELVGFYGDPFGKTSDPLGKTSVTPIFNDCGFYTCADSLCKN
jgi:hypothetical protein